jgi:uncharacterized membrane protein/mono/diheme cytochrome c family protein
LVGLAHAIDAGIGDGGAGTLAAGLTPWWHFSGAFHPAVSHFPIALLMVAALVESWSVLRRRRQPLPTTLVCLYIGAAAAVVAAVLGLGNAAASGDKGATLDLHKWLGIGVAALAVVSVALSPFARRDAAGPRVRWAFRGGVFAAAALVGLVGSYGGKLVHGETYYADAYVTLQQELARNAALAQDVDAPVPPAAEAVSAIAIAPAPTTSPTSPATAPTPAVAVAIAPSLPAPVLPLHPAAPDLMPSSPAASSENLGGGQLDYARDVEPIFLAHCVKCHNESKKKGGYRLDARELVFAAGESGKVAVMPGRSDESLLIKLTEGKGEYADSMMPPKGDPLTYQQIALIRRWIDEGAK